jgi:hypothetical protein
MKPPPLPLEVLARVTRVARFDGTSILAVSGSVALLSAAYRDVTGATVGLMVAAAGAIELHGVGLLRTNNIAGVRWLVSAQVWLMGVILAYVAYRIARPDIEGFLQFVSAGPVADSFEQAAAEAGETVRQYILDAFRAFYFAVALLTVVYQGGMAIYYIRRRGAIQVAFDEEEAG